MRIGQGKDVGRRWLHVVPALVLILGACGEVDVLLDDLDRSVSNPTTGGGGTAPPDAGDTEDADSDPADSASEPVDDDPGDDPPEPTEPDPAGPTGQFSSWVGGGDPAPCDDIAGVPPPPYLGLGYGNDSEALGGVVHLCFLGFDADSPILVEVSHPDGSSTTFEASVGAASTSDVFSDPLAGDTMTTAHDTVSWVSNSSYPAGTYVLTATQGDLTMTADIEFVPGGFPFIQAIDHIAQIGSVVRFAISGVSPGTAAPLHVYRDTGVLDETRDDCSACSIFELFEDVGTVTADSNGGASFELTVDDDYRTPAEKGTTYSGAFCLVTTVGDPWCDAFTGGWFRVEE